VLARREASIDAAPATNSHSQATRDRSNKESSSSRERTHSSSNSTTATRNKLPPANAEKKRPAGSQHLRPGSPAMTAIISTRATHFHVMVEPSTAARPAHCHYNVRLSVALRSVVPHGPWRSRGFPCGLRARAHPLSAPLARRPCLAGS
jgi:hypothetical protein